MATMNELLRSTSNNILPVPEIYDDINHSLKQPKADTLLMKRPPKLKPRHYDSNRTMNTSSTALAISFKDLSCCEQEILSSIYNKYSTETYYDQCFETIRKIGEGSFGEVFKVRSKADGHLYAVKKSKQFFRSGNYRDERLEEVKRVEEFSDHKHCVTLYKAWEQDDRLYMQMELCQGSLEDHLLKTKLMTEKKIWSILLDMLLALKSLHDKNLIHLDIKLDNILIGDDGLCKLGDFGLVVDIVRANLCDATEGDSRYIAPEILMGKFTKGADIFSLGIAILELSCQLQLPSSGPLWQELRSGILPEKFINKLSDELLFVIKTMMSPNPLDRPTVDDLLTHRRIVAIKNSRKRWIILQTIKSAIKNTNKYIWAKLSNLKMNIYNKMVNIFHKLKMRRMISKENIHVNTSQSSNDIYCNSFSSDEFSNSLNECSTKIFNSTPLNSHGKTRPRKDISKCDARNYYGGDGNCNNFNLTPHSPHEISESIAKKLFFKSDDSD